MEEFAKKRLEICRACPLCRIDNESGPVCDNKKYISPDGAVASYFPREGWKKGCGCRLQIKCANINKHCIIGKW